MRRKRVRVVSNLLDQYVNQRGDVYTVAGYSHLSSKGTVESTRQIPDFITEMIYFGKGRSEGHYIHDRMVNQNSRKHGIGAF